MSITLGWYGLKTNARDCYAFANIRSITVKEKNLISPYTHKKNSNKFFCFSAIAHEDKNDTFEKLLAITNLESIKKHCCQLKYLNQELGRHHQQSKKCVYTKV